MIDEISVTIKVRVNGATSVVTRTCRLDLSTAPSKRRQSLRVKAADAVAALIAVADLSGED